MRYGSSIIKYSSLSKEDHNRLLSLVNILYSQYNLKDESTFCSVARKHAEGLPKSLKNSIIEFLLDDESGVLVLKDISSISKLCGVSPSSVAIDTLITNKGQILLGLILSFCGTLVGYSKQQGGRVFNDIIPIQEFETTANSSSGSSDEFVFHTEDAYHPYPPDYFGLYCVRNNECAETLVSYVLDTQINDKDIEILSSRKFLISPNYGSKNSQYSPEKKPLLFGFNNSFIQFNLANCVVDKDQEAKKALDNLCGALEKNVQKLVLSQGDLIILDNLRVVHGRGIFSPNYGPERRWLIRGLVKDSVRRTDISEKNGGYALLF